MSEPTGRQARRVLGVLRQSRPGWACLREFGNDSHVARNRISEMRAAGWAIEVRRCQRHNHEGSIAEYRLTGEGPGTEPTNDPEASTCLSGAEVPPTSAPLDLFGCWTWTGRLDRYGYGTLSYRSQTCRAHRLAYQFVVGPIPAGLTLDHLCHTLDRSCAGGPKCPHRACVNPAHLDPCTQWENVQRGFWGMPK